MGLRKKHKVIFWGFFKDDNWGKFCPAEYWFEVKSFSKNPSFQSHLPPFFCIWWIQDVASEMDFQVIQNFQKELKKKHSGASFENFSTLLHLDEFGRTFDRNGETRNETEGYCFLKFFRMGSTILAYFRAANRESSSDLAPVQTIFPELKMSAVVLEIISSVSISKNVGSRPGRR